jgi:hypothetical protein
MVCVGDLFVEKWANGCCLVDADCDDYQVVTFDWCLEGECVNTYMDGFCEWDWSCFDGNPCNIGVCINSQCHHGPDLTMVGCCQTDFDCNDNSDCTTEYCNTDTNNCVTALVPDQDPKCCWLSAQCDDGNQYTVDSCGSENQCINGSPCACNAENPNCSDNNICTTDTCDDCQCKYTQIDGCCIKDNQCPSYGICAAPHCNLTTHSCGALEIYNCCEDNSHCTTGGPWDDGDDCTLDICLFNECRHIKPADGC